MRLKNVVVSAVSFGLCLAFFVGVQQPAVHAELIKILNAPDIREQLHHHGFEPQPGTPEALTKYMEREYATWGRVVKEAKITAN